MIPRLLLLSLALAMPTAGAAEPPSSASPADQAKAAQAARPRANAAEVRQELSELRAQIGVLSRRMAELSLELGDAGPQAYAFRYLSNSDRGMIGVVISPDDAGARIDAVTPEGPASRAGLQSGDLIVSINGKSLARSDSRAAQIEARRQLADLDVGEALRLGYRRGDSEVREISLAAERRKALNWQELFVDSPEIERHREPGQDIDRDLHLEQMREAMSGAREAMRAMRYRLGDSQQGEALGGLHAGVPWWGINLATLNPELGRYFGARQGVLVLSAAADSLNELEAGDVITKIGAQTVERPEQALRALRDHVVGTRVDMAILRDRKPRTLSVVVPEYKAIFDIRPLPVPPAPPAPPAAPTAPAAPMAAPPPAPPAPPVPPTAPHRAEPDRLF